MKPKLSEVIVPAATVIGLSALAFCSFSQDSKREIAKRLGDKCLDCGTTESITYHHIIPEFWLKRNGLNSNDPRYGVPVCRTCHDQRDKELLPKYGINIGGRHKRRAS